MSLQDEKNQNPTLAENGFNRFGERPMVAHDVDDQINDVIQKIIQPMILPDLAVANNTVRLWGSGVRVKNGAGFFCAPPPEEHPCVNSDYLRIWVDRYVDGGYGVIALPMSDQLWINATGDNTYITKTASTTIGSDLVTLGDTTNVRKGMNVREYVGPASTDIALEPPTHFARGTYVQKVIDSTTIQVSKVAIGTATGIANVRIGLNGNLLAKFLGPSSVGSDNSGIIDLYGVLDLLQGGAIVESSALFDDEGAIYHNTVTKKVRHYTGTAWEDLGSGDGDVVGPASAIDNNIAVFDGITGKLIKDSKVTLTPVATNATITITDTKTLTVPLDASVSGTNTGDQDLSGKMDKVPAATLDHLATFDAAGQVKDGGEAPTIPVKCTGAEIITGTNDTKFATPKAIADSTLLFSFGAVVDGNLPEIGAIQNSLIDSGISVAEVASRCIMVKVFSDTQLVTTGDGKFIFCIPELLNGKVLTAAHAYVTTVSSSGLPTVQIRNVTDSVDMLTTRITIDATEYTSYTATTPPVIDTAHDDVATGDLIAVDVDVSGTGTKGLGVMLTFS